MVYATFLSINILVCTFSRISVKSTVKISFLLCTACGHCLNGWKWTYPSHPTKLPKSNLTSKIACSVSESFRYLWDLFPLSGFITAPISGLQQLVTMVDENNDSIPYGKNICCHPKGSKCTLPTCMARTITAWLCAWNHWETRWSMKKGTSLSSFELFCRWDKGGVFCSGGKEFSNTNLIWANRINPPLWHRSL